MKSDRRAGLSPDEVLGRLHAASQLLREGRQHEAVAALRVLTRMAPEIAEAQRLLGVALNETGDLAGAEAPLRAAMKLRPGDAKIAVTLVEALIGQKKGEEAVTVLAPFVNDQTTNFDLLTWTGLALQSAARFAESVTMFSRATWVQPDSGLAHHNLASGLIDDRRYAEAQAEESRARALGLNTPEMLVTEGRAARGQNRLPEAIDRFAEAVRAHPAYTLAVIELAETIWLATGDAAEALRVYDAAPRGHETDRDLARYKAKLQEEIGDTRGAYETLKDALGRLETPALHVFAAQMSVQSDPSGALDHARRAVAMAPRHEAAQAVLAQVYLATGDPRMALNVAEGLTRRLPMDQYGWALTATAMRLLGDARYARLNDYDRLVDQSPIDTPEGWSHLDAYLADLAAELRPLHRALAHPIGQSMRHGSQTEADLARETSPAIAAFFGAIDGPIRRYMASLGPGRDPLRGRLKADYALNGIWSVNLRANGFHVDHLHPKGWLSSAFHVALPSAVATQPEGWLKFGEPGIPTAPALTADHFVKPAAGHLVLFPSYMWHGTVPFSGSEPRLSIAFDVVPR